MKKTLLAASVGLFLAFQMTASATLLDKQPDLGSYWHPLHPNGGTYVYSDSFVAPVGGTVTSLGMWLDTLTYDPSTSVMLQVWGSVGGNVASGPDYANVLATTAGISGMNGGLTYYSAATVSSSTLVAGATYWFSATVVGGSGSGSYQVGGHTQNSDGIVDNGTFWYSNDSAGQVFDGIALTPEMAFTVEIGNNAAVPEPSTYFAGAMMLLPFGFGALRKLRKA